MPKDPEQLIHENYPQVAAGLLNPLLTFLSASRRHCGGDVDKFLILVVVGVRTTSHPEFRALPADELLHGDVPVIPGFGTNVRSIADTLDIPKETVRRKVQDLVEGGYLVRRGGKLYLTAEEFVRFAPVRGMLARFAACCWRLVSALRSQSDA